MPESTRFALQDAMDVDGDPQVALAMEHSRRERERLASRFANRPSSRGGQKCCQCTCNGNGSCIRCACASTVFLRRGNIAPTPFLLRLANQPIDQLHLVKELPKQLLAPIYMGGNQQVNRRVNPRVIQRVNQRGNQRVNQLVKQCRCVDHRVKR